MQSINFNDGFKIFDINGDPDRTIRINTADIGILERLENSIDTLNGLAEKAKKKSFTALHRRKFWRF